MSAPRIFDEHHYGLLNRARGEVVLRLLAELKQQLNLSTAIDVGCGLGYFAGLLNATGFEVTGVDGRSENAREAACRYPAIEFHTYNVEDPQIIHLGTFDLVLCFGLLYHLENPFLAIRNLHTMTRKLLLVEGLTYPGDEPIMGLVDETSYEDQGLRNYAFYPTESCLVKMMYLVGYPQVYRLTVLPDHDEYRASLSKRRIRTVLAASMMPLSSMLLAELPEPPSAHKPWQVASAPGGDLISRLHKFASKPLKEKFEMFRRLIKGISHNE